MAFGCKNELQPELKTVEVTPIQNTEKSLTDPNARFAKVEFSIEGMTCEMGCAKTIERKMAKMDGYCACLNYAATNGGGITWERK